MRYPALLIALGLAAGWTLGCGSDDEGSGGDGGGGGAGAGSGAGAPAGVAATCVDAINQYRATLGLTPYVRWTDAESCADGQAASDSQTQSAHGAFGNCGESAQNECPGWPGPPEQMIGSCLDMMWGEGPGADFSTHGHYLNMSSTQYSKVACGFHVLGDGSVWSVQDFSP